MSAQSRCDQTREVFQRPYPALLNGRLATVWARADTGNQFCQTSPSKAYQHRRPSTTNGSLFQPNSSAGSTFRAFASRTMLISDTLRRPRSTDTTYVLSSPASKASCS